VKRTSRRRFLGNSIGLSLGLGMLKGMKPSGASASRETAGSQAASNPLPGTKPLTVAGDLAAEMVEGIREYLIQATADCLADRSSFWKSRFTSVRAYEESVAPNRERLRRIIGAIDPRVPTPVLQTMAASGVSTEVMRAERFKAYAIRWEVCSAATGDYNPLEGAGLLLEPAGRMRARVLAVPDADCTPEAAIGLAPGVPAAAQFPRRLAEKRLPGDRAVAHRSK